VLSALLDILTLESDYQQALLDHEAALVRSMVGNANAIPMSIGEIKAKVFHRLG